MNDAQRFWTETPEWQGEFTELLNAQISPGCSLERMMLKLKLQYFGHLMQSWLIGKDSDAGRDWGQEEKGTTGDEMAGWHHRLNGHESRWTPGVGDGQGGLACCDSWGRKDSDTTERLNWTAMLHITIISQSHFHFKVNRDTFHENPLFFLERLQCLRKHNKY